MSLLSGPSRLDDSAVETAERPRGSAVRGLWWLSPWGTVLLVTLPVLARASQTSWQDFRAVWNTPKWIDADLAGTFAVGAAVFVVASLLPLLARRQTVDGTWPALTDEQQARLRKAARVLFGVTVFGYLVFIGAAVARGLRPSTLVEVVTTQDVLGSGLKGEIFQSIPGVTTLTQVGIAFAAVAAVLLAKKWDRGLVIGLAIVTVLALGRAFLLAERLAVLEVAIPLGAVLVMRVREVSGRLVKWVVRLLPLLLLPLLAVFFGLFEFSRSWAYYRVTSGGNFWDFALQRLEGYYLTAVNNGAIVVKNAVPGRVPYETLAAFWEAPGVEQLGLYERLAPADDPGYQALLQQFGNPEFNSPCGICSPIVDWGITGGLVWLALAGLLAGVLYRLFGNGSLAGLLFYPLVVTTLFELPRLIYVAQGRTTPALVALVAVWWYLRWGRDVLVPEPAASHGVPGTQGHRPPSGDTLAG